MYGMSEKEFWEDDPQLYWAYHIFYIKKVQEESEKLKYNTWLNGNMCYIAQSCALRDGFSKEQAKGFPTYNDIYKNGNVKLTESEKNKAIERENNYWARR